MKGQLKPAVELVALTSIKDYYRLLIASKAEKSVKQKMRYDVVLFYIEGYSRKQISQILHIPSRTVSYHISRYENSGSYQLMESMKA